MRGIDEILAIAVERKGSVDAVLGDVAAPLPADALAATADDRWLATMAKIIFQTGISWGVVENKWPGIEAAFRGFDPGRVSMMDDAWFDALLADSRVIRSGAKIEAIRDNAAFIRRVAAEWGSFGRRIAAWPRDDHAGLLDWLAREGSRLGGNTGAYVLRMMGRDGYMLSSDVVARLQAEGVIEGKATSKKARAAVQAAFNRWHAESGRSLTEISRILARSIDAG